MTGDGAAAPVAQALPSADPIDVGWAELDTLVAKLAASIGHDQDLVLAITRGGLVPAGILAYRLDLREILVAGVEFLSRRRRHAPLAACHPLPVREAPPGATGPRHRRGVGDRRDDG